MKLSDTLDSYINLTPKQKTSLNKAGFKSVADMLWHFPYRYQQFYQTKAISDLKEKDEATIRAKITKAKMGKTWKRRMALAEMTVEDETGKMRIVWFNQPYMAKMLKQEETYYFSGKINKDKKGFYMSNPVYEETPTIFDSEKKAKHIEPIYSRAGSISPKWFAFKIEKLVELLPQLKDQDPIPKEILTRYNLPGLKTALREIHSPSSIKMAEAARKRFSFEEIFYIQLSRTKDRILRQKQKTFKIKADKKAVEPFIKSFPFSLTSAQQKAVDDILADFGKPSPMARLLEGDVGSGKTAVAATAAFAVAKNSLQIAYMAPTEVLARQHFAEFIERFSSYREKIGLITSAECLKYPSKAFAGKPAHISRNQLLKWVANGEIPILIGTHSLIQGKVKFKNLALVIIDEQHRFGVNQRAMLVQNVKNVKDVENVQFKQVKRSNKRNDQTNEEIPHLLSMTATPIPRTLALTIYGDLDLTLLDEMPPGRKKIETVIVPPDQRQRAYEQMREEIKKGRQAYVVCPRIEEEGKSTNPISLDMKSVKAEHRKLSKDIFPEFEIAMLHGKMKPKEKEKTMAQFREGKTNILVSTSVIEVGVNVPNATIMMIEGAERFGLAQLHQLRGRILRGTKQPYCFVFSDSPSSKTLSRLKALTEAKNGFELAEHDLKLRGPGELSGTKQWGISDIGMEALKNIKMVEAARKQAQAILKEDLELKKYPQLKEQISKIQTLHFE